MGITTSDLDRALGFYRDALGLRVVGEGSESSPDIAALLGLESVELRIADLDSGDGRIFELIEYVRPKGTRVAYRNSDSSVTHVAFAVDDLAAVHDRLIAAGARVLSRHPVTIQELGGPFDGATCLYVQDPDGIILELVQRRSS